MVKVRANIIISGRVQGVFFRYTLQEIASKLNVTGWAKNTRDGNVEAVLEGSKEKVEKVIEWAKQGPPRSKVKNIEITWDKYQNEFSDFSIRYF